MERSTEITLKNQEKEPISFSSKLRQHKNTISAVAAMLAPGALGLSQAQSAPVTVLNGYQSYSQVDRTMGYPISTFTLGLGIVGAEVTSPVKTRALSAKMAISIDLAGGSWSAIQKPSLSDLLSVPINQIASIPRQSIPSPTMTDEGFDVNNFPAKEATFDLRSTGIKFNGTSVFGVVNEGGDIYVLTSTVYPENNPTAFGLPSSPSWLTNIAPEGDPMRDPSLKPAITIQAAQELSVTEAKLLPDNDVAAVVGRVSKVFSDSFYIQDTTLRAGIKVVPTSGIFPAVGDTVCATGTLKTDPNFERYIETSSAALETNPSFPALRPTHMSIKDLGGPDLQYNSSTGAGQKGITGGLGANNVGLQVVTEGTVSEVAADHVILTYGDGPSLRFNIDAPSGTPPTIGTLVQGAGVVTLSTSESVTTPVIRVKDYNSFSAL